MAVAGSRLPCILGTHQNFTTCAPIEWPTPGAAPGLASHRWARRYHPRPGRWVAFREHTRVISSACRSPCMRLRQPPTSPVKPYRRVDKASGVASETVSRPAGTLRLRHRPDPVWQSHHPSIPGGGEACRCTLLPHTRASVTGLSFQVLAAQIANGGGDRMWIE